MIVNKAEKDAFGDAVADIRSNYDSGYGDRVAFAGDLMRTVDNLPTEAGSEAVLQPILRYQNYQIEDMDTLFRNKFGDDLTDQIVAAYIEYAARRAE